MDVNGCHHVATEWLDSADGKSFRAHGGCPNSGRFIATFGDAPAKLD